MLISRILERLHRHAFLMSVNKLIFSGHLGVCHVLLQLLQPVLSGAAGSGVAQLGLDPLQLVVQLLQIVQ